MCQRGWFPAVFSCQMWCISEALWVQLVSRRNTLPLFSLATKMNTLHPAKSISHCQRQSRVPEQTWRWRFPSSAFTREQLGRLCEVSIRGDFCYTSCVAYCKLQSPFPTRICTLSWQAKSFHRLRFQRSCCNPKSFLRVFRFQTRVLNPLNPV